MSQMKLILTQEVTGLGSSGDTVEVKGGYGRNYLLPRGLAILATRGAEKQIESLRRARAARDVRSNEEAQAVAGQLSGLTVRVPARAGEGGRLFGRVTTADVAAAVTAAGGPELDRRRIELPSSIKTTGQHTVTVRVHAEVSTQLTVEVVPACRLRNPAPPARGVGLRSGAPRVLSRGRRCPRSGPSRFRQGTQAG